MLRCLKVLLTAALVLAAAAPATAGEFNKECRNYSPAKTVQCVATKQRPPGGVEEALAVWNCESGFGLEGYHDDPYHGPFQYMSSTYTAQRLALDDISRWFDLSTDVHDVRSNIVLAVAWAAHYSWAPWRCA
jgi:hypothetical protein